MYGSLGDSLSMLGYRDPVRLHYDIVLHSNWDLDQKPVVSLPIMKVIYAQI